MQRKKNSQTTWPTLPYADWKDTLDTLHMWMQIAGKVKLQLSPFLNHWWEVVYFVTPTGITTGRIPYKDFVFSIDFNFLRHTMTIYTSKGNNETLRLTPMTVATFYTKFFKILKALKIAVKINTLPSEVIDSIPFKKDMQHKSYDKKAVERWWTIQYRLASVLDEFRSNFRGKSSPTQFFWGSFDLNTTRFSGNILPDKKDWPEGYSFMRYAENEENFAVGFWPGDAKFPHPAFYAYIYPAPLGYETIKMGPSIAYFNKDLSECILPYESVRLTKNPEKHMLNFFETTYRESARLAGWDREKLKNPKPKNFKK